MFMSGWVISPEENIAPLSAMASYRELQSLVILLRPTSWFHSPTSPLWSDLSGRARPFSPPTFSPPLIFLVSCNFFFLTLESACLILHTDTKILLLFYWDYIRCIDYLRKNWHLCELIVFLSKNVECFSICSIFCVTWEHFKVFFIYFKAVKIHFFFCSHD